MMRGRVELFVVAQAAKQITKIPQMPTPRESQLREQRPKV
jgi:hypothetical protein